MPKKSFQYNTYLWSYGQNDISTGFPIWPRKPFIKYLPMVDWCFIFLDSLKKLMFSVLCDV